MAAIQEYASKNNFIIVKTYLDAGKSGVIAKNRRALQELLNDVTSHNAKYQAVLVYDVSRWGRYPNSDEAAYYEFVCFRSGIPLHYCAEPFQNDGTAFSSLLKALKRTMAAEFSRELGERVFRGKTRIVQLGYWVGGQPGYGYRRLMVSAEGTPKVQMSFGEHKHFMMDRVKLIPGPLEEVHCVREIFSLALEGKGCSAIAHELNRRKITRDGHTWSHHTVQNIVRNPKYKGWNVWHRGSQRLRANRIPVKPEHWISKPGAFEPLVDQEIFDKVQTILPKGSDYHWSDEEILQNVRRLLKRKGRLSENLLRDAHRRNPNAMPSTTTIHGHFGRYRELYEIVGYKLAEEDIFKGNQAERSIALRRSIVENLTKLFPENLVVTHLPGRTRSMLLVDKSFMVGILLCRPKTRQRGGLHWVLEPKPSETQYITLVCPINGAHNRLLGYFLFPKVDIFRSHRLHRHDLFLKSATHLSDLSQFYTAAKEMWTARSISDPTDPISQLSFGFVGS